jgi:hypothetical protein
VSARVIEDKAGHRRGARRATALALALSVTVAGCASARATPVPVIDARLHVGEMGTRTNFELRQLVAQSSPAPQGASDDFAPPKKKKKKKKEKWASTPIFWVGVVLSVVGASGTIAFGTGGLLIEKDLTSKLYDSLGPVDEREMFSEAEYNELNDRGQVFNALAITSVVVGLVGMVMSVSAYGYEYTHCGPLAPKRRRCEEAGYRPPDDEAPARE